MRRTRWQRFLGGRSLPHAALTFLASFLLGLAVATACQ